MSSAYREIPQTEKWIPYEERGTAWWIWNELYRCGVPWIQLLSMEEIQEFGMPSSGDPAQDYATANEIRQIMIPISKMVMLYHHGVQVEISDPADTKRIYERISDHLIAWKSNLGKSLNIFNAPLDDLKLMDKFANAVYEHAKYQFTDETISSLLSRQVDQRHHDLNNLVSSFSNPTRISAAEQQKQQLEDQYPQRESMADFFQPYRSNKVNQPKRFVTTGDSKGLNNGTLSKPSMSDFFGGVRKGS